MKLTTLSVIGRDLLNNIVFSKVKRPYFMLFYVIESGNWSIKWDGKYITKNLNTQKLLNARITRTYKGIHDQIIHFGSANAVTSKIFPLQNKSNRIVLTWFHFVPDDPKIKSFKEAQEYIDVVHTSCTITKGNLIEIGVPEEKIVVIPLGVDLNIFKPVPATQKNMIRKELGLPQDKVIIGSFQKDGVGWGDGLEPKLVKGPDIFVDVIDNLSRDHNIFVLLTGPARGYVKKGLDRIGVPYKHIFLKNYPDIPK
jgi:glycosyltransferase involved in cell wall biosynthesis